MNGHYIMQFFDYKHLRADLQPISARFSELAQWIEQNIPGNPEQTVCLRKLLEAKDCAVRAHIFKP
jgi:hypothetical protein